MKKTLILLGFLIMMTGCTLDYNLVISEKTFEENILILEDNTQNWNKICETDGVFTYKERIDFLRDYPVALYKNAEMDPYDPTIEIDGVDYYEKEKVNDYESYGLKMSSSGKIANMNDLRSLSYCYDIARVINNKDEYIISTSFKNNCFDKYPLLDELNINITTDMKVTSNNADSVNGDTYTWKITRSNYSDKSISLAMQSIRQYDNDKIIEKENQKREEREKKQEKTKKIVKGSLGVIGIIVLVAIIILGIVIVIKNRKENKI